MMVSAGVPDEATGAVVRRGGDGLDRGRRGAAIKPSGPGLSRRLGLLMAAAAVSPGIFAQSGPGAGWIGGGPAPVTNPPRHALIRTVDAVHSGISTAVENTAMRIDSFFADDRFYADSTESYARLSLQSTWEQGEDAEAEARLRVRVDLPGTEKRLRLFVEGGEPDGAEAAGATSIRDALDENDYNLGVEGSLERTGAWDVRPGIGIKAGLPPDPFVRMRAIRYERFGRWLSRFSGGVAQYLDDGTEVLSRLDFDRAVGEWTFFRSASRVRYRRQDDRIDFRQDLSLFRNAGRRLALGFDLGAVGDNDPDWDVDYYYTQVRTRWRAYQKWLFLELTPQVVFREEDDYDPTFRITLRADAVFGDRYKGPVRPVAATTNGSAARDDAELRRTPQPGG
jgi:hypothetical protein